MSTWLYANTYVELDAIKSQAKKLCQDKNVSETVLSFLKPEQQDQLNDTTDKTISDFLYYLPKQELTELREKFDNLVIDNDKKSVTISRTREAMENSYDWTMILLEPGILSPENHQKFLEFLDGNIEDFLRGLSQDSLHQILVNINCYKQSQAQQKADKKEIKVLSTRGNVKRMVDFYKELQNPKPKSRKLIKTRAVAVPDHFIKKMGIIHSNKSGKLALNGDEIMVKETYSNGNTRMVGYKNEQCNKVGVWKWWRKNGDPLATFNYDNNHWTYVHENGLKSVGNGLENVTMLGESFLNWLVYADLEHLVRISSHTQTDHIDFGVDSDSSIVPYLKLNQHINMKEIDEDIENDLNKSDVNDFDEANVLTDSESYSSDFDDYGFSNEDEMIIFGSSLKIHSQEESDYLNELECFSPPTPPKPSTPSTPPTLPFEVLQGGAFCATGITGAGSFGSASDDFPAGAKSPFEDACVSPPFGGISTSFNPLPYLPALPPPPAGFAIPSAGWLPAGADPNDWNPFHSSIFDDTGFHCKMD